MSGESKEPETSREDATVQTVQRVNERWMALHEALAREGVPYRSDSRLSSAYVEGSLDEAKWTADAVAKECALMFWLYNYTEYPTLVSKSIRDMNTYFHKTGDWETAWRHLNQVVHAKIKHDCIEKYGGVPTRWPWSPTSST